jgi:immune inhibitor A
VDAHPETLYQADGDPWRARVQLYDAPFGTDKADNLSLHEEGERTRIKGLAGNPVFDDTKNYFDPVQTDHGVKVRGAGVKIEVLKEKRTAMTIRVTTP